MFSFKPFLIVALVCSSVYVSSQSADDQLARLLVSKQVLNKLLVQDSDILVKVCIYKIFNNASVHNSFLICFFIVYYLQCWKCGGYKRCTTGLWISGRGICYS